MKKAIQVLFILLILLLIPEIESSAEVSIRRGWLTQNGQTYFYKKGKKLTGLRKIEGHKYYFREKNGSMVKSRWVNINGDYYYFGKKGRMFFNRWITYKNRRYYVNQDGIRVTHLQTINRKLYAFTKKGILRQNKWVKKNGLYYRTNEKGIVDNREGINTKDLSTATRILYESPTLHLEIRKNRGYDCDYWTAHIKIQNPAQLRSGLSFDTYGGVREKTSEAVKRLNGIIGINGSAFQYSTGIPGFDAVMIKNGHIYNHAYGTSYSLLAVSKSGILFTPKQGLSAEDLIAAGVKDTYNFGPAIIVNGIVQPIIEPFGDTVSGKDPRSAIGMIRPGEYVLLVADGRSLLSHGLNYYEMADIFQRLGCLYAYNLDGGGSATLTYRGVVLNNPSDGQERACGDFLYFTE